MVPLAQSLRRAGHEVGFATAERFCRRVIEPAGFPTFAAGLSPPVAHQRTMELPGAPGPDEEDIWRFGALMFAEVAAPAKVGDLVRVIREWDADLVVHDMTDFAGPIAAAACGIGWVNHSFGALQPAEFWDLAADLVAPTWEAWSVEPGDLGGMFRSLYLDVCPAGFQSPMIERVPVAQPLRPVAFDTPAVEVLPAWVGDLAERPTVYVTLGTVANHTPKVFENVLAAVAQKRFSGQLADGRLVNGQIANVIVTVGPDRDPGELGPLPPNVHVERYLPQSLLFPHCDLVVCHGGSGTTLAAVAAGLPMLVLPQEANQFWNADRTAALGAGRSLRPDEATADAIEGVVAELLRDSSYRSRARLLAAEIQAMPHPDDLVPRLEALASGHAGRS